MKQLKVCWVSAGVSSFMAGWLEGGDSSTASAIDADANGKRMNFKERYMKIGLIDVDGHSGFPNLALCKLSAWHKAKGDSVEWYEPLMSGHMNRVYMSKVFTFTNDYPYNIDANEVLKGGTGYKDYTTVLPDEIEHSFPDYSIYPNCDYAIGFLTRGCIRSCPWCVVPKKEGKIRGVATWQEIKRPDSDKILFLDNNVLASEHGLHQIESIGEVDIKIDFNQGLDARLIDKPVAKLLANCKWVRFIRISCDTSGMIPIVERAVTNLGEAGVKPYRIFVYTLVQDIDESHERILAMKDMGLDVFAQPYRDFDGGEPSLAQKRLANWCNKKSVFKSCTWEEFRNSFKEYA